MDTTETEAGFSWLAFFVGVLVGGAGTVAGIALLLMVMLS